MGNLECLDNSYTELSSEDMYDVSGGLAITIAGVTLVITAKGLGMLAGIIGGTYSIGYAIGQGWAYIKK
ncbi:hypothetical protein M3E13_13440 [Oceanobacillus kimchii]|uniref:hypothetical protein n=1 Tax=Oceanobacillus kimchii TaxID=746691 RepID=UPI000349FCFE|nr:hypothetical protein [Oceanobacillus kimchii]MCT1577295.1 hypothetical protein [Oceanobacillus kimchii]MCT2136901.1 hypothetical protein [Oceanobacillus kimchii]